jgi:hypothetical protein
MSTPAANLNPKHMNNTDEKRDLQRKRSILALSKREHETKLIAVKNVVRSGGRLSSDKYKQCCDSQNAHSRAIMQIERQLAPIKDRLREIADAEFIDRNEICEQHANGEPLCTILEDVILLQQQYQSFAADGTRVASMRQMAAEFALKLNPIIQRAKYGVTTEGA